MQTRTRRCNYKVDDDMNEEERIFFRGKNYPLARENNDLRKRMMSLRFTHEPGKWTIATAGRLALPPHLVKGKLTHAEHWRRFIALHPEIHEEYYSAKTSMMRTIIHLHAYDKEINALLKKEIERLQQ